MKMTEVMFGSSEVRRKVPVSQQVESLPALLRWRDTVDQISKSVSESGVSTETPAPPILKTHEWNLLLAASSVDASESDLAVIRSLLRKSALRPSSQEKIEWETVLRLADDHGTSSLMYRNLSRLGDDVPVPVLASLRQSYERNIHKSLFLSAELIRILDCLDALGLEAIPYKGLVLSQVYYGDMAMRQSGDMDLFVRRQDVMRIKRVVCELGYTLRVPIPENAEDAYIASGYECTFDSPAGRNLLELQWALQPRFYAVDFDMDGLFERAVHVEVAGRLVKTPPPEDLLLVLSVHAAKHVWGRLIWLCDIAQIVKLGNLNWDLVQSRARVLGVERILHITLLLANRFLGVTIPEPINDPALADRVAAAFADEIAVAVAAGVSYEEHQMAYFWLMMQLRERLADRARFLTRLTFTPGPGEWEIVGLPKVLFPLYRLVRLGRLAARFARG
jgi:hypothetical protein